MMSSAFALIGQSFPSETCESLYQALVAARTDRRRAVPVPTRPEARRWRGCGEAVILPRSLGA